MAMPMDNPFVLVYSYMIFLLCYTVKVIRLTFDTELLFWVVIFVEVVGCEELVMNEGIFGRYDTQSAT